MPPLQLAGPRQYCAVVVNVPPRCEKHPSPGISAFFGNGKKTRGLKRRLGGTKPPTFAPPLLGCILFGLGVGNLISLPPLIAQNEFEHDDVPTVVALISRLALLCRMLLCSGTTAVALQ